MAIELINVGLAADDGTGDLLRDAFIHVNNSLVDLQNSRAQVFYSEPTHPYFINDLYLTTGKLYVCTADSTGAYQAVNWELVIDTDSAIVSHGDLLDLGVDDHTIYYNQTRGDARYSLLAHTHTGVYSPVAHTHAGVYEPVLGNPAVSGYVLSSTTAGVRSWIPATSGGTDVSDWFEIMNSGLPNEYLRCKKSFAGDYEIQAWSSTGWLPPTIWESMPVATPTVMGGIILGTGATLFLREDGTWQPAGGGSVSMVYPGAGIGLSTGLGWGTSITNNSANWNTAYGWGNHASAGYAAATSVYTKTEVQTSGSAQVHWDNITNNPVDAIEEPTGLYPTPTLSVVAGVLNITGVHTAWYKGTAYAKTTQTLDFSASANGIWYVYYNSSGVLTRLQVSWSIFTAVPICIVYKNGANYRLYDERHGTNMTSSTHAYLHLTRGTAYISGLTAAFADTSINLLGGQYADEDLFYSITGANPYQVSVVYRDVSLNWLWTSLQNSWWKAGTGGRPQYDNAGTLAELASNEYGVYYLVATNDTVSPIISLMGQAAYGTLAAARAATYSGLSFGTLPSPEFKVLYKVIVDATSSSGTYAEAQDLRGNPQLSGTAPILTDHGSLTGLLDDDHTIYHTDARGDLRYSLLAHTHAELNMTNFTIMQESGKLVFKYGTTIIASLSSAGLLTAANDIAAFGTP
jgi:hypothetical protein